MPASPVVPSRRPRKTKALNIDTKRTINRFLGLNGLAIEDEAADHVYNWLLAELRSRLQKSLVACEKRASRQRLKIVLRLPDVKDFFPLKPGPPAGDGR